MEMPVRWPTTGRTARRSRPCIRSAVEKSAGITGATRGSRWRRSVDLADQIIQIAGDAAYELGIERGHVTLAGEQVTIDHRVTNVYRREAGSWKIVHHHTDVAPAMVEVLNRLKSNA